MHGSESCDVCGGVDTRDGENSLVFADDGIIRCVTCWRSAPDTSAFVPDMMVYDESPPVSVLYVPYGTSSVHLVYD